MPSRTTISPSSSAVPRNTRRGTPSARMCRASRTTTGSAHAPPMKPNTCPEAVMTARQPSLPEDGLRRHTTVANANASPRCDNSRARSRTSHPSMVIDLTYLPIYLSISPISLAVALKWRHSRDVKLVLHSLPHSVRQQGHVDVADPGVVQSIMHRVHEC